MKQAFKSNRSMLAMTGVTITEFEELLITYEQTYLQMAKDRNPDRKRSYGGGRPSGLKTMSEKLFYALWYLKTYPTFDVASFFVGIDRSNCCRDVQFLLKVLETALGRRLVLPERKINSVEEFLEKFPLTKDIFFDGTERRVQKPTDRKKRNKLYSGKKKATTRKTVVGADEKGKILTITKTKSGRRHDKKVLEKSNLPYHLPEDVAAWTDTGFQGFLQYHANTMIPYKHTKGKPLTSEQKEHNRIVSSFRVIAERAISGIKRMKSASDIYRNRCPNLDDMFTYLSAGLWNLHLSLSR